MNTWKFISAFIITLCIANASFCQKEAIDNLKKLLPSLTDTERIDCLNELSQQYIFLLKFDSAQSYATKAYEESKRNNYINGLARAYHQKASIAFKYKEDHIASKKLADSSRYFFEKTHNKKGFNRLFLLYGWINFVSSKYEQGIKDFETCAGLSRQANDSDFLFYAIASSALIFEESGYLEKAFEKAVEMQQFSLSDNKEWKARGLEIVCDLYSSIEDYKTSLVYYRQVREIKAIRLMKSVYDENFDRLKFAGLLGKNLQFDSAKILFDLVDTAANAGILGFYFFSLAEYWSLQNQNTKALTYFLKALAYYNQFKDYNQIMRSTLAIAKVHLKLKNYNAAFYYAGKGIALAKKTGARNSLRDGYEILYFVYDYRKKTDSALFYYQRYIAFKDAILSDQVKAKLIAYTFNQKIDVLRAENEIRETRLQQQVQQVNLQKSIQASRLQRIAFLKNIFLSGILILLLTGFFVLRNLALKRKNEMHLRELAENELQIQQLENEKTKAELQQEAAELEMQALCAQMNPHFIFNCLNAINGFILNNESEIAADYLTKFSRLIRLVLNHSQKKLILLTEELDTLNLYLYMEQLRFANDFYYDINFDETVDTSSIFIPPMLLQPFAENAIRHGLMQKQGNRKLHIHLHRENNLLCCTVTDNGIGRKNAARLKSISSENNKSMGLHITKNRISLLNQDLNDESFFEIKDLEDKKGNATGTRVYLKIQIRDTVEENAVKSY